MLTGSNGNAAPKSTKKTPPKYGIGELYGKSFAKLTKTERDALITGGPQPCPFQLDDDGNNKLCNKKGGVCSLRFYERDPNTGKTQPAKEIGFLRATCPSRFLEDGFIFKWIGKEMLGTEQPVLLAEVPYLTATDTEGKLLLGTEDPSQTTVGKSKSKNKSQGRGVGNIDFVLADPADPKKWCALEMQAVYFSGGEMNGEFNAILKVQGDDVPFPATYRRLDYRSSGPKRLMPQLQTKVPSLRRWGKKMVVLVDLGFWASLGKMDKVDHISNADIAWFVVQFDDTVGNAKIASFKPYYTTLEAAIEGLTGGKPLSLPDFEQQLAKKIQEQAKKGTSATPSLEDDGDEATE